jgi:hypothetical protein
LENQKERDYSEDISIDGKIILEWILGKQGRKVQSRFIWLRIGINGGLQCTR